MKRIFEYSIDYEELLKNITEIKKWCEYRNEVVHAMFNKDIEELRAGYKEHVEHGYKLGRFIDDQVKKIKMV